MPTTTNCPSCQGLVRVPDELRGAQVRCPSCQGTFTAPTSPDPATSPPVPESPPPSPESDEKPVTERIWPTEPWRDASAPPLPTDSAARPTPQPEEELRPCPYCGKQISARATSCRFCGEEFGQSDERPWEGRERFAVRRDCEPHRGVLILVLGIVSIVVASFGFASYGLAGLVALPLGIVAWVLGHRDLIKMQAKAMDPEGRGLTQAGYVCGIVGTVFGALMSLCCAVVVIFFGVMMTMGAAAGK